MNDDNLQQFALLDILLSNWDGILIRLGPIPPTLEQELAQVAQQISTATEPEEIARLLDRFFDLTEETPAYNYVRELIRRAALPEHATTRGFASADAPEHLAAARLAEVAGNFPTTPVSAIGPREVPVFFATNRQKDQQDAFGGACAEKVSYGIAHVTIPETHRTGHVERPGRWRSENAERHVVIAKTEVFGQDQFAKELSAKTVEASRRELLVFLHGYQVTFEEAARRAAQVAQDIHFEGRIVLFSWPSAGALLKYSQDEESAAISAFPLINFLRGLEGGPWEKIHLVAHSMGNRVLTAALAGSAELNIPLRNIVLIAADVPLGLFKAQYPEIAKRLQPARGDLITSYASKTDRALFVSWFLHRYDRVGTFSDPPFIGPGMETINATAIDTSLLGLHHSYFGDRRSVLTDLGSLIGEGLPAARRHGLRAVQEWWEFPP